MSDPILFYDVTRNREGITDNSQLAVSPNTWRVRYALNIKGIPFKTIWLDFAEIHDAIKAIGAESSSILPSGAPQYTVPTVYNPSTRRSVTDSYKIIDYLEAQYPDTHPLFPRGTRALQRAFMERVIHPLSQTIFLVLAFDMLALHTESGAPVWRRARECVLETTLEAAAATGARREGLIEAYLKRFEEVGRWMDENDESGGGVFLAGDAPSAADCELAGWLTLWREATGKKEGLLWKAMMEVDGGRFERYMRAFEKWQTVV